MFIFQGSGFVLAHCMILRAGKHFLTGSRYRCRPNQTPNPGPSPNPDPNPEPIRAKTDQKSGCAAFESSENIPNGGQPFQSSDHDLPAWPTITRVKKSGNFVLGHFVTYCRTTNAVVVLSSPGKTEHSPSAEHEAVE